MICCVPFVGDPFLNFFLVQQGSCRLVMMGWNSHLVGWQLTSTFRSRLQFVTNHMKGIIYIFISGHTKVAKLLRSFSALDR